LTPSGSAKTIIGQRGWACPNPASGLRCGPCEKKWIYGKTREEVHAKWIKLQEEAARGPVATKTPSVGEYLVYWHREIVTPNLAPKTVDNYDRFVRLYIRPVLGSKNLARLSSRDVQAWVNKLAQTCSAAPRAATVREPMKISAAALWDGAVTGDCPLGR
jgi:hypothetical protein